MKRVDWEKEKGWSKEECISMARLRSGHSLELGGYRMKIDDDCSGKCIRCGEEKENFKHVLECDAGEMKRRE